MKCWVEPQVRDAVVDFVHKWEGQAELKRGFSLTLLGLRRNSLMI